MEPFYHIKRLYYELFLKIRFSLKLCISTWETNSWGLSPNNRSIWLYHVRSETILSAQKPSYIISDHLHSTFTHCALGKQFCSRNSGKTPLCSRKTPSCSRKTLLCSRKTPLCFRKTPLCSRKTPFCSRKIRLCSRKTPLCCGKTLHCVLGRLHCAGKEYAESASSRGCLYFSLRKWPFQFVCPICIFPQWLFFKQSA